MSDITVSNPYLPAWNVNDSYKTHQECLAEYFTILSTGHQLTVSFVFAEIESSRASSLSASKMDSKSGVVGKFRSFYSTIEQVRHSPYYILLILRLYYIQKLVFKVFETKIILNFSS